VDIAQLQSFLGWCAVINIGILLWWFGLFVVAHDWIYALHTRWFDIPKAQFDAIHYSGMAIFKLAFFLFNVVPYCALMIVG
jgi:signal transduction histidine kinase